MPKLVSQFLTMSREEEASKLRRRELKKLKDRERSFERIMDPEIAGELFEDAKGSSTI